MEGSILENALNTSAPNNFQSVTNSTIMPSKFWGNIKGPYPTNTFWTNLVLEDGNKPIYLTPYQIEATVFGLWICFPKLTILPTFILSAFLQDFSLMALENELGSSYHVQSYDLLSVTLAWDGLQIPLVRGSPYVTGIFHHKTPLFRTINAILSVNNQAKHEAKGTRFEVKLNSGHIVIIYASSEISLHWTHNQLQASSPFTGVIRVAFSTGETMTSLLDQFCSVYPVGGTVNYTLPSANRGIISFTWNTTSWNNSTTLLMTALPHHVDTLIKGSVVMKHAFDSIKGPLTLVAGNVWQMEEDLTGINWHAPTPIDPTKVTAIVEALNKDMNIQPAASDPYFFGKEIARSARLALIADQFNLSSIAASIRSNVKVFMNQWLTGQNSDALQYDKTWGGICSKNGLANSQADFGNGIYNDHHFHYGYHVYAAAVIAKEDPQWLQKYSSAVLDLIRDYANPSTSDPYFPVTRCKDWYDGHSWASGLVVFEDSKNQESTSEAINSYYAIYLWGLASGNSQLKDLGRIMMATEIRTAHKYWHMTNTMSMYPPPFSNNKVVGVLWSTKVDYATWFGSNVEFIHCIQMLPFTPISELYLPASWIQEEYPLLTTAFSRISPLLTDDWKGYIYMAHAIIDAKTAWKEVQQLTSYDDGNTKTNTLYWIATRPNNNYLPK